MAEISNYKVAASPHEIDNSNTRRIMLDVLIALLPCVVCGTLFYGLYALLLVVICTALLPLRADLNLPPQAVHVDLSA